MVFHIYGPKAWLRVAGEDAFTFLQGQFANDLRPLRETGGAGAVVYGLWLNQKGRVLADSFVLRAEAAGGAGGGGEEFWIGSYTSAAEVIRERLEAYVIADDVTVTDETAGWGGASLLGAENSAVAPDGVRVFRGRRAREASAEWIFPVATEAAVRAALRGATEIDAVELERRRIAGGIPAVPTDLGPGDLPQEGGLDADAVSFTKGCYLGQEVMARLKAMGQVRRRLVRVHGAGAAPAAGTALFQAGKKVGEMRSGAGDARGENFTGLAMLSLLACDRAAPLAGTAEGAGRIFYVAPAAGKEV